MIRIRNIEQVHGHGEETQSQQMRYTRIMAFPDTRTTQRELEPWLISWAGDSLGEGPTLEQDQIEQQVYMVSFSNISLKGVNKSLITAAQDQSLTQQQVLPMQEPQQASQKQV